QPSKFIKNFLKNPNTDPSNLAFLVAALEDIPRERRDQRWSIQIAQAIGRWATEEASLEYAVVHVAPAIGAKRLVMLAECARTVARKFRLEDLPEHLMAYVRLAVKYAYESNQPFDELASRLKMVLDALRLRPAQARDTDAQQLRRLRMLHIIRMEFVKWEEED